MGNLIEIFIWVNSNIISLNNSHNNMKVIFPELCNTNRGTLQANTGCIVNQVAAVNPATGYLVGANATTPVENIQGIFTGTLTNDYRIDPNYSKDRKIPLAGVDKGTGVVKVEASVINGTINRANVGDNFNLAADGINVDVSITGASNLKHLKLIDLVNPNTSGNATAGIFVFNNPVSFA